MIRSILPILLKSKYDHSFWIIFITLFFVLFSSILPVCAQERIGSYMAYSWRLGLSGGINSHVCESRDGFLWISTDNGLIKFDGKHYERIPAGPGSLADNIITDIAEAPDQNIWIGSLRRGVSRFDPGTQAFKSYPKLWSYDSHIYSVNKILCLNNGQVWLGTGGMGLALYMPQMDTFQFFTPGPILDAEGKPDLRYHVKDMVLEPGDSSLIWLVCTNDIFSFDTRSKRFTSYPYKSFIRGVNPFWTSIAHDGKEGLWLGSWGNGMHHYNTRTRQLTSLPFYTRDGQAERGMLAMDVEQYSDTCVLWACALSGLFEYNPQTGRFKEAFPSFKQDESSDSKTAFHSISKTKNAGVFIGAKGYLFQLHGYYSRLGKSIYPAPWAPDDEVYISNMVFDSLTKQYFFSCAGPLSMLSVKQGSLVSRAVRVKHPDNAKGLDDLVLLPGNRIIALDFEGRLYELNANRNEVVPFRLAWHVNGTISHLKTDSQGFLWALTQDKLYRLHASKLTPLDSFSFLQKESLLEKPFSVLHLYHLETDARGCAWVGSSQGIWFADPYKKQLVLFHPENNRGKWLKDKLIKSMVIDPEDRLWVGYNGDGLDIYDTRKFEVVDWVQGASLPTQQINDLAYTPGGYILAPTTEGVLAIDRKTLDWQLYATEDGLYSQFMDKSLLAAPDGMVFVNHGTRLNVFHESDLLVKHEKLRVNIQRLTVNNAGQDLFTYRDTASYLTLPHSSNNISVSFSAMHWLYPFKTKYSYRFQTETSAGEWLELEEPFIQLSALKPGRYVLELAAKGAGNTSSLPKVLHVEILPPFWLRSWFIGLCAALFVLMFYGFYRFRVNQLKKQLEVRNTISRNLHDDIGSSLSNIQILNELTNRNLGDREKAITFLKRSKEDIGQISEALSDIVWNVNPKYDDLRHLFARMKRYAAESFEGKDIACELQFPEESGRFKMNMEQRRDFYLIFKESIHNLVKYSRAKSARVALFIHQSEVVLEVQDDGLGFSVNSVNSGSGLVSMQQRAEKWKGKLDIVSSQGQGTLVRLTMPLK